MDRNLWTPLQDATEPDQAAQSSVDCQPSKFLRVTPVDASARAGMAASWRGLFWGNENRRMMPMFCCRSIAR